MIDGQDPYTLERRLCDDEGMVSDVPVETPNVFAPGLTYLGQINNLRGLPPVEKPFACTGHAHLAGEHIRCTSPAHDDRTKGLYAKYYVAREGDVTGKHDDCRYFVLDPQHDPIARRALDVYATLAEERGYVSLAEDLLGWLSDVELSS